jgi:hypothetical protein
MKNEIERALRTFPETFRSELARIQAGARNGGLISPRRHAGLLTEFERAKTVYDAKLAGLRAQAPAEIVDETERKIELIAAEFRAGLSTNDAAQRRRL